MNDLSQAAQQAVKHATRLTLYARQWLSADQAQDVVQDALTALLSQRTCPADPLAWMYTAVRHSAIDQLRAGTRRRRREERAAQDRREWFEATSDSAIDADLAQRAMESLPRELREIVVLRIWGELGFVQIAAIAQVSVGTAHQRFTQAIGLIRAKMENPCKTKMI